MCACMKGMSKGAVIKYVLCGVEGGGWRVIWGVQYK